MTISDPIAGFAFVYMEDERDADDAIRRLDRIEHGRKGHRLRVEWSKQDRDTRRHGSPRKPAANTRPSKTLFVINFDPVGTRTRDLERHFEQYGKIANVRIRKNFAFIQFETQDDATRALDATNNSKFMDRVISVEYAVRDDDDRRNNGYSPERRGGRDASPDRRYGRGRLSPSPYQRERGSPDYGRGGGNPTTRSEPARASPTYNGGGAESPIDNRYPSRSRSPPPRERSRSVRSRS
ncbi:serine/arginine-rich splicing factor RS41-like isoform X2 [Impatiens glandulifera]|uniref:serine/arginine-rich splicing factor RS41-like isoform X2 n=1 Tax=Impatiens glandulifera TaxID=253017 RepID=UPI001FB0A9BC|nr:serine/arginine-rich splicing factor RS41-like isoform X2 [Impatiens glandulifera]